MELGGQEYATLALVDGLRSRGHFVVLLVQDGSRLLALAIERGVLCRTITMNKVFESLVAPWLDVYNRGGYDNMKRLETMAKLGYDTPVGVPVVREAAPVSMETPQVASHGQVDPAVELARRLKHAPA